MIQRLGNKMIFALDIINIEYCLGFAKKVIDKRKYDSDYQHDDNTANNNIENNIQPEISQIDDILLTSTSTSTNANMNKQQEKFWLEKSIIPDVYNISNEKYGEKLGIALIPNFKISQLCEEIIKFNNPSKPIIYLL